MKRRFLSLLLMLSMTLSLVGCSPAEQAQTPVNNSITFTSEDDELTIPVEQVRDGLNEEIAPNIYEMYGDMRAHFIDVGQGDCTFIELGNGMTMLIDAGNPGNGDEIVDYIKGLQYSDIDIVVATHPHDDHIGGMATVLDAFKVDKMYMPEKEHTTNSFDRMLDEIEENDIELIPAKAGTNILESGYIDIDILAPVKDGYSNLNNYSAVVRLTYNETVFLFTGDAEKEVEQAILNEDLDADILKVGHHGSDSSSSKAFIDAVSPTVAVISCGVNNRYGHPDDITLQTLENAGAEVLATDINGTVIVQADMHKKIKVYKESVEVRRAMPSVPAETIEPDEDEAPRQTYNATTVYITRTGKKYHRSWCSYLKSKAEVTLDEAKGRGLEPCSRCDPPY